MTGRDQIELNKFVGFNNHYSILVIETGQESSNHYRIS